MKARDQLALLIATNRAYAGGDAANSLAKKLEAAAKSEDDEPKRRWRSSKKRTPQ